MYHNFIFDAYGFFRKEYISQRKLLGIRIVALDTGKRSKKTHKGRFFYND